MLNNPPKCLSIFIQQHLYQILPTLVILKVSIFCHADCQIRAFLILVVIFLSASKIIHVFILLLILKISYSVNCHFSFFTSFFIQMYCFFLFDLLKYLKYSLSNSWFWTFKMTFIWGSEVHNWSMKFNFCFCFAVYIVSKMIFATECYKFIFLHFLLIKFFLSIFP